MAKRKTEREVTETESEPVIDNTLPGEETEPEAPRPEEDPEIAVDYGDGVYQIIKAPGGVTRAVVTVIDGEHYQHVDEYQGRWAYRKL